MAVNSSRSQNQGLREGATDGKYRKARPDTEVIAGSGDAQTTNGRSHLHPPYNYGFVNDELPLEQRGVPGLS